MAVGPKLELRHSQSLVMTQQLQQSIKLLQLSSLELAEYIDQELEKNPLLATDEQGEEEAAPEEGDTPATEDGEPTEITGQESSFDGFDDNGESDTGEDSQWDAGTVHELHYTTRGNYEDDEQSSFESSLQNEETLQDHLIAQLQVDIVEPVRRFIGMHLIDMVDDAGYITGDWQSLAQTLGCELELIESTLKQLQQFDPPGICARDLKECLAIQLRERDRFDPAMQTMLEHLDLVARGEMETLRKRCGVDAEDMRLMLAEIRTLNPKPGHAFNAEISQPIQPDVYVRRKGEKWTVELNSSALPRVLVNRRYYAELNTHARGKQEKKYLSDQLATANWLVKALDQRAQTILKVATDIVRQQEAFFQHGIRHLRPLTLKDVAAAVGLHESTVSRVTSNKYMATSRGTFELKYFFTSSIQSAAGGENFSSETIRYLIKEMIEKEGADKTLSDDDIADILKNRGMDIARRTVAKYRESLNIPSSFERRRIKKQAL